MADPAHKASLGYIRCSLSINKEQKQTKMRCDDSGYRVIRRIENEMNCKRQWGW